MRKDRYIKTLKYKGLEIKLFSPPDNGRTFWVMDIKVASPQYHTSKGIKVGDSVETLMEEYPMLQIVPDGRTDENNCAYGFSGMENNYSFLQFEIKNGQIGYFMRCLSI